MEFNKETFEKALKANKIVRYQRNFEDVVKSYLEIENQALRQTDVSGAVALLKFLKEEQQKKYADAKDYMTANQHQYYEEGCDAVLQLIEMQFMNKLIDRYWELRREIINTPPIYFWKLKKLFREYKEVKEKIGR